jgi:PAS domain S-box-containing protein
VSGSPAAPGRADGAARPDPPRRPGPLDLLRCPDPAALLTGAARVTGAVGGALYRLEAGMLRAAALTGTARPGPGEADRDAGPGEIPPKDRMVPGLTAAAGVAEPTLAAGLGALPAVPADDPVSPLALALREAGPVHAPPDGLAGLSAAGADGWSVLALAADGRRLGVLALALPPRRSDDAPGTGDPAPEEVVAEVCAHRLAELDTWEAGTHAVSLELAMENAGIGAFDWDFATGRLTWDVRTCRIFGLAPDRFDGRVETFFSLVHPEDRPSVEAAVRESRRTGRYRAGYRVRRPDGTERHVRAQSRVFHDEAGRPRGMVGVAQDRTEEHRREETAHARQEFVVELLQGFAAAASTDEVVTMLGETVLPRLGARRLAVFLRQGAGPLELAGEFGYPPEALAGLREAAATGATHPGLAAVREGRTMLVESPEQLHAMFGAGGPRALDDECAWLVLPLESPGGLVGACVMAFDRPYALRVDEVTVRGLSGLLGQALARARLRDERRRQMTELQSLMLPRALPELPGLELAVAYRPGADGLEVGGDWYDALPLPDGTVTVVIGDVQGHSVEAAAVMGQLRVAMRTYADDGHHLAGLLARGNGTLCAMDTDLFATCCVVEADPERGVVRVARAGHPYPLLMEADGRVRELVVPGGMPLGCFAADEYPVAEVPLRPGATLLLYTDGLVEDAGRDYDDAVGELAARLAWWAGTPQGEEGAGAGRRDLRQLADRMVAPVVSRPYHDDVAVLLLHRPRDPARRADSADQGRTSG